VEEGYVGDVSHAKTLESPRLKQRIQESLGDHAHYVEYSTEYWKRVALSITPLFFGLLGVGLGVVRSRSVKSNAVFVAFGAVLVYWTLHILGSTLAEKAYLSPFWAMQLSNLVLIPIAILSFRRSAW